MNKRELAIEQAKILQTLIEIADAGIILNTFVNSFIKKIIKKEDGIFYLHGNFHLGGTLTGRLSSSKINLQNLPSTNSKYAKDIKKCFIAPPGYILVGVDFSSLEDKISALITKDPNKIKVYTDNYDAHCLRAFSYYGDQMPDIINTVISINSIKSKYPNFRQDSKTPTFLLTYGGTYHGLIALGLSEKESKNIEENYHMLYQVSDKWVQDKLIQASHDGYVTVAFGLRLRTPILSQVVLNTGSTPYKAKSESRTAGNAMGQSYGMLNNRSAVEFHTKLLESEYIYDIKPISHIHDAQYFLIKEDIKILEWFNNTLIPCVEWQELPEIKHNIIKLGGEISVFHPNWAYETTIPNKASIKEIKECFIKDK